jgi:hypothetical protein
MGEKQIVAKLRAALSEEIRREADVVYILAQTRKLLDDKKPGQPHFALKLYCHWALHVDLEGADTTMPFLEQVDTLVDLFLDDKDFSEQYRMLREFVLFENFREQLKQFFESHHLPTELCNEDRRWRSFLSLYAGVVEDGSLSCRVQAAQLKRISKVTLTKGRPSPSTHFPFEIVWYIHLLDGKTLTGKFQMHSTSTGTEVLSHGFYLR